MDQLPRLGNRELICLLLVTCNYVVSVRRGFPFLWVLGMGYVIMPPTLKKWGTYWFRLVRMCVCVCVCVCVCIHVRDIVWKLHVLIPHGKIADAYFRFSLNYLPLSNNGPLTNKGMKFCKCRISKSFIARNLKLVMLIRDDN